MAIAFTIGLLVVLAVAGYTLYNCWREQQSYQEYQSSFRQELRSHVEDASRYVPVASKTRM